jgi:hypothetical protein
MANVHRLGRSVGPDQQMICASPCRACTTFSRWVPASFGGGASEHAVTGEQVVDLAGGSPGEDSRSHPHVRGCAHLRRPGEGLPFGVPSNRPRVVAHADVSLPHSSPYGDPSLGPREKDEDPGWRNHLRAFA